MCEQEDTETPVSSSVVYLFADTNLLFQCLPLEKLDWSAWNQFDEVRLIVSKPVLREIDYHKNKGNDRVSRRARGTSAMFRKMLNDGNKVVRDSAPRVILSVEPQHQYTEELENRLNLQERDDQLIATAYEFAKQHRSGEVRLLTHDTTPLYTARSLGLAADVIPEDWLLMPEKTESEKELAALKAENARLKKAEPSFAIRCLGNAETEIKRYEISVPRFEPLTDAETNTLMQRLKERFPLETDFGPREPAERLVPFEPREFARRGTSKFLIQRKPTKEVFKPAKDKAIARYQDEAYPQWLAHCEAVLSRYHRTLQGQEPMPRFCFFAKNHGTRPATDALITIEAQGGFQIQPPARDDESENRQENPPVFLSNPPSAPRGRWRPANRVVSSLTSAIPARPAPLAGPLLHPPPYPPPPHDSNAFYYKPHRPRTPQDTFCLECDQWRHGDGEMDFEGVIYLPDDLDAAEGALICRIQAGNLSKAESKLIPVRITARLVSTFDRASAAVEALTERSEQSDIEGTDGA